MSMCPIGRVKEVDWAVSSKKDPRWDKEGTSTVAMVFQTAPEALKWIKKCEKKYGKRPKDLYYHCMKV